MVGPLIAKVERVIITGKSEPAKECVTTHRTNGLALKMDGAQASYL
jgi:hypothetical protein